MELLFCALAGREFGFGHLNRCLSIAEYARKQGLGTTFLVLGEGADIARRRGHSAIEAAWPGTLSALPLDKGTVRSVAIIDVAHPSIFSTPLDVEIMLSEVRKYVFKLAAIDSLGAHSFAAAMPLIPVDAVVIPYVGGAVIPGNSASMLVGPEYAVLNPAYAGASVRRIRDIAERVLVTFGGADPQGLTLVVLTALAQIKRILAVRVVIGPLFPDLLTAMVEERAGELHHDVELVYSPDGLHEHMQWSDIAVAASGLVKYELAATGTPGVIVSIDEVHDNANRPFSRERLHVDLGVTEDAALIGKTIEQLLGNAENRRGMAERGQNLIDGRGVERLIGALIQLPMIA